ncbi:MAG: type II secretion system protein [Phycisphaerales bacterium]|nr:type II secretion system protein [Phycisphaerales bacterium]
MSTPTRSKCSRNRGNLSAPSRQSAFTLIELLVVVAIIALLMSILLPSLGMAREQARAVVCGQRLRDLGTGMAAYFAENKDWIPGINTSGVAIRAKIGVPGAFNDSKLPVQSWDWMTPSMANSLELPAKRADRFREMFNTFRCPSQKTVRTVFYPAGLAASQDRADFVATPNDWSACSYLMPSHFQYWGTRYNDSNSMSPTNGITLARHERNTAFHILALTAPPNSWEVQHETYKSQLNRIGNPARKIAAADGHRYLDAGGLNDFDPSPEPYFFGAFGSSGAWWFGDTSYGVRAGTRTYDGRTVTRASPSNGANLPLSYRHGGARVSTSGAGPDNRGTINAMFFDGSVLRLTDRASRNPQFWYPKGARVRTAEGMNSDVRPNDLIQ